METKPSTAREDGLTLTDSWEEQTASRPKTNDVRLDQKHWSRHEGLLEVAADKGSKDRDTVSSYHVVLLSGPLEETVLLLLLIFDVYSEQQTGRGNQNDQKDQE